MDSQLKEIFKNISAEKHYAPCTYSEIPSGKTDLNITSGQNANWTYANFFVQNDNDNVNSFRINEGQYVIKKETDRWVLLDYKNNIKAVGIDEIRAFVDSITAIYQSFSRSLNLIDANRNKFDGHKTANLQQIFYGAPGTGKSHEIDKNTNEGNRIRTTFHPDYDYASFVGCYKPTKESRSDRYNVDELVKKLKETKNSGTTYPCQKFATKYWKSLRDLNQIAIKELLNKAGLSETFNVEVSKGVAVGQELSLQTSNSNITYSFIPQAFIKAYVEAWRRYCQPENTDKDFYLIIEEINRGNCAQIFGDLFQLLDRTNTGFSRYSVETENDLQRFLIEDETFKFDISLNEDIADDNGKVIASAIDVMNGKVLVLPPNFHIWATMNTSDQSLFPIDSAFKRRWDWKYMPIKYSNKDWKVVLIGNTSVEWVKLQQKLNDLIYDATESEDKMLGDWFVKADTNNVISEEVLVGKIIFYLWNDVAKVDAGKLFDLEIEKHGRKCKVSFSDFYNNDGTINSDVVKKWLKQIDVLKEEPSGERQNTSDNEASPVTGSDTNQE
ncbi:MAG: hypothetical protein KBT27_13485 [Prevotellaceae bacterium]|nr:hypothetical protein [Candidatus Faecinaster equi]